MIRGRSPRRSGGSPSDLAEFNELPEPRGREVVQRLLGTAVALSRAKSIRQILSDMGEAFMATKAMLLMLILLSAGVATVSAAAQPSGPGKRSGFSASPGMKHGPGGSSVQEPSRAVAEGVNKAGVHRAAASHRKRWHTAG